MLVSRVPEMRRTPLRVTTMLAQRYSSVVATTRAVVSASGARSGARQTAFKPARVPSRNPKPRIRLLVCLAFTQMFLKMPRTLTDRNRQQRIPLRFFFVFGPLDSSPLARTRHRGPGIFPSSPRAGLRTRIERRSPRATRPVSRLHHPGGGVLSSDPRGNVLLSVNRPRPRGLAPRAGSSARGR